MTYEPNDPEPPSPTTRVSLRPYQEIPLTRGLVALIDTEDYHLVVGLKWHALANGYAAHTTREGSPRSLRMHHLVLPRKPGFDVDHVNGNRADNRRVNLRYLSKSANAQNRHDPTKAGSGVRGVYQHKSSGSYAARITIDGREFSLGYYRSVDDAAVVAQSARASNLPHTREASC